MAAPKSAAPAEIPWFDREDPKRHTGGQASPRSPRDLEILRALSRRIKPGDAGAHNNLGFVYYNKGLYAEAIEHFEAALDLDPRMQVAERNLQITYFGTGFYEQLVGELRTRLQSDPTDAAARERLARALLHGGDPDAALQELHMLEAAGVVHAPLYQRIARAELKRGNAEAALDALRKAARNEPDNARVHFQMGEVLYQLGLSVEARGPLEHAVRVDPLLAEALHLLAFVYGDLGDDDRAQRAAARAVELNPSLASAEANLSLDSYSPARYEELVGDRPARPAVAEDGTLAHYSLGLAFRQKALFDEALREFRLAAEQGEDEFLVQQAEAELLLLKGASADAAVLYGQLLETESASPKLWNELGVAHHQSGDLDDAEAAYRRALDLDPAYALARSNLAVVQYHHGDSAAAEASLRSALREGRAAADIGRNLGLLLHRLARHDEALGAYRAAIAADANCGPAWTGLGVLLLELAEPAEAKAALVRAVEIDPQLAEARYHLAFALSALGDFQGALRETKLALERNPYIPAARFRLLIDLQFEEASVLAPELDVDARVGTGEGIDSFQFESGALDAVFTPSPAGPAAEPAGQRGVDVEAGADRHDREAARESLRSARTALQRGNLEAAAAAVQRALANGAPRTEAFVLHGEIFLQRGLSGEAIERFEAVLREITASDGTGGEADTDAVLHRALLGAARSLLDLGRMPEAVEAAERLCALAPDDTAALRVLGEALMRVADYGRAVLVLEQARGGAPRDVGLLTQLGQACLLAGDPDGAESALRRALEIDADAAAARAALGRLLVGEDRFDEAAVEFRRALAALPSYGEAAFGLAELERARGDVWAAIAVLVDLLIVDPYHLDGLVRLGDLLREAGKESEAAVAYRRALRFHPGHHAALLALERLAPQTTVIDGH